MSDSGIVYNNFFQKEYVCLSINQKTSMSKSRISKLDAGDKIILPPSALDLLTKFNAQTPFTFVLRNKKNDNEIVYAGVIEFTAPEKIVYVPSWMMSILKIQNKTKLFVDSVNIPKATNVVFKVGSIIAEKTNPTDILEYVLRDKLILHEDMVLYISFLDKIICIEVQKTNPSYYVRINDVDLEYSIVA
jgi:ubiquitin fusion degradation protein 1